MQTFKWKVIIVPINKIKPTPDNFKLSNEIGTSRFNTSVNKFGLAGVVICNKDLTLIDGNNRWKKAIANKEKTIQVSVPDRQLSAKEFSEFSKVYDLAKAGDVDMLRITQDKGTTKDFFKTWGVEMPEQALKKLRQMEEDEKEIKQRINAKDKSAIEVVGTRPVTLLFTPAEAEQYLAIAESLYKKYKTDNITDLALKLMKAAKGK